MRVGPIRLCCCNQYQTNNIDLTQVTDVDSNGIPPPFIQQCLCCAGGKVIVDIDVVDKGTVYLTVAEEDGEGVVNLIMNQIEESQMMERD